MLDDRKVGGILVESRSQAEGAFVAIGVGLNLLDLQSAPFVGIQKKVDPKDIGDRIVEDLLTFEKTGFKNFKESFEAVMWRKGEEVSLKVDDKIREVRLEGVSDDGLLMTRSHGALNLSEHGEIVSA
jgi:biotin-(acetyl-CoA carboxylase) ligase